MVLVLNTYDDPLERSGLYVVRGISSHIGVAKPTTSTETFRIKRRRRVCGGEAAVQHLQRPSGPGDMCFTILTSIYCCTIMGI